MRLITQSYARILAFLFCFLPNSLLAATPDPYQLNLHRGVTSVSQDIYHLHMTIFWICVVIGVIVFGILFYSLFKFRKSKGAKAAQFHGNTKLEILWAVIPFVILIAMAIPATAVLFKMHDQSHSDLTIKITGYQWKWHYDYLDYGIHYFSNLSTPQDEIQNKKEKSPWYLLEVDKPLVVPIHEKIRFLLTSNDVIHSWWVPELGVKKDTLPGFITEAWTRINKPGTYRGQCTELCGMNHGYMPIVVIAKSEADFKKWVAQKQGGAANAAKESTINNMTLKQLMTLGKGVYKNYCAVCHKDDGTGMPPTFPGLKDSPVATTGSIEKHIDIIVNGVSGSAMQAFGNQLSEKDIAAVTTYERNAWGNNTGDVIQPLDIKKFKEKNKK